MKTETNEERFKQADELLAAIVEMGDGHGKHKEGIDVLEWLIQQAERVQELEESIKGFAFAVEVYSEMPAKEAMEQVLKFAKEEE